MAGLLVTLLLAAAPAPLAPPARTIPDEETARQLCLSARRLGADVPDGDVRHADRRRLLDRTFEADVPLDQVELDDVDEAARLVTVRRKDVLRTRQGVRLFVEDREVELTATAAVPAQDAAKGKADRPLARTMALLLRQPRAALRVRFRLADLQGAGPCGAAVKPGGSRVVAVEPLDFELLDEAERPIARWDRRSARPPPGGTPSVTVAPATVDGAGPPASVVTELARGASERLRACFEASLARDPTVEGSIVLQVAIAADGRSQGVVVTADSVADEGLVSCASGVLGGVGWGPGGPSSALIPVHFERL